MRMQHIKKINLEVVSGLSFSDYTNDHYGELIWGSDLASGVSVRDRYYLSISDKSDISIFSKAIFNISDVFQAYIDLQTRFVNYSTTGLTSDINTIDIDENFTFFNPKVGLTYNLNSLNSLYFSFSRANREPNRNDYESNPNGVRHEELNDFEFGWRHENSKTKTKY